MGVARREKCVAMRNSTYSGKILSEKDQKARFTVHTQVNTNNYGYVEEELGSPSSGMQTTDKVLLYAYLGHL